MSDVNKQLLNALKMVLDDPDALDGRPRTYECVVEAIAAAEQAQAEPSQQLTAVHVRAMAAGLHDGMGGHADACAELMEQLAKSMVAAEQAQQAQQAEPCTNSDSWNCKYCRKAKSCKAIDDPRNYGGALKPQPADPVAWVRFCSDGLYEGPLMNSDRRMDEVRRASGTWTPLYTQQPAKQQAEPVAWEVRNGVVTHDFYKTAEDAEEVARDMQKSHDLSGSIAAFNVRPVYAQPPAVAEPGVKQNIGTLPVKDRYFLCRCEKCGWLGSSEECRESINYMYGDGDYYCPACGANGPDEMYEAEATFNAMLAAAQKGGA